MSDNEWTAERIAELRALFQAQSDAEFPAQREQARTRFGVEARRAVPSLLDALESARAERDAEVSRLMDGCAALEERIYWLERYIRDPQGSVRCEDRNVFDPPCGGCEGCITAQVVYGVTGKAVTS